MTLSQCSLSSTCVSIRIEEPLDEGIIIAGTQVVEPGFGVVVVAPVAEGVGAHQEFAAGIAAFAQDPPPGIVDVPGHVVAGRIQDGNDVPLEVQQVVIGNALIHQGPGAALVVILEVHGVGLAVRIPGLPDHLAVLVGVIIGDAPDGLAGAVAKDIIFVEEGLSPILDARQLPAMLP